MMLAEHIETRFFDFESDFVGSLKCIPMIVRYKLDACRVKLKLADWAKFNYSEKDELANMSCYLPEEIEGYAEYVNGLAWKYTGTFPSVLTDLCDTLTRPGTVPDEVIQKAAEWECEKISDYQWNSLDILERFALVKLSRSGHEGRNFPVALREFLEGKPL